MAKDPSKARKFFSLFGATQYPRTEVRERWSELQKRAAKLPKTDFSIKNIDGPLEEARGIIFKDVKGDSARRDAIDKGTDLLNSVEDALNKHRDNLNEKLKQEGGPPDPVDDPPGLVKLSGKERKEAKEAATKLTARAEKLDGDFKKAAQARKLQFRFLTPDAMKFHQDAVQLRIATLFEMIKQQPVTKQRETELGAAIDSASKLFDDAFAHHQQAIDIAEDGLAFITQAEASGEYTRLAKALHGDIGTTSFAEAMERLRVLCRSSIKNTAEITRQKAAVQSVWDEIKQNEQAYTDKYAKSDQDKQRDQKASEDATAKAKEFDEAIEDNLKLYTQAMEVARKANLIQSDIKKVHEKFTKEPTATAAQEAITFNDRLTKDTAALKNEWKKNVAEYDKLVKELKAKVDTLGKDMRGYPNLALEWTQIDNLLAAFSQGGVMEDATKREQGDELQTKMVLGAKLKTRLEDLEKNKAKYETFSAGFREVKLALKKSHAAGEKSPLAKFYPDDRKKLAEDADKLDKALPTKPAEEALKDLAKLLSVIRDKGEGNDKGTVPKANEAYAKKKEYDSNVKTFSKIMNEKSLKRIGTPGRVSQTPQAFAIEAYEALSNKRPLPPIKDLETAMQNVETAFAQITSNKDFLKTMGDGQKGREENDRWKKDAEDGLAPLVKEVEAEMKPVSLRFSDVKAEVKASNGDENLLKSAKKSYEDVKKRAGKFESEAKKAIEAAHKKRLMAGDSDEEKKKIADGLKAELDKMKDDYVKDIQKVGRKIENLSANPRGEKGERKRMLVPLRNKLNREVLATKVQLTEFATKIEDFAKAVETADAERAAKLRKFIPRVQKYRDKVCQLPREFDKSIKLLIRDDTPDPQLRAAREKALKIIGAGKRRLMKHPLTLKFAKSPFPTLRTSGKRLNAALRRLEFTVLTAVAA